MFWQLLRPHLLPSVCRGTWPFTCQAGIKLFLYTLVVCLMRLLFALSKSGMMRIKLQNFCPEFPFSVTQVVCFNQIALPAFLKPVSSFRMPKTTDWGWGSTGKLRDWQKFVWEAGGRGRSWGLWGLLFSFTVGSAAAEHCWGDDSHGKHIWAAGRGPVAVTLIEAFPQMVVQGL